MVATRKLSRKDFFPTRNRSNGANGLAAEAYLCQKDFSNNIEPTVFALSGWGVAQKRRELRVRSDGCKPPQPTSNH
jgi:hypothetical protein